MAFHYFCVYLEKSPKGEVFSIQRLPLGVRVYIDRFINNMGRITSLLSLQTYVLESSHYGDPFNRAMQLTKGILTLNFAIGF